MIIEEIQQEATDEEYEPMEVTSLEKAVRLFVETADWLTKSDAPAVTSLIQMAKQLDNDKRISATLMGTFGLAYRSLRSQAPDDDTVTDPLEKLLQDEV